MKILQFKRKREKKTNYRKRLALVKSRLPRLVIRISNKNTYLQIIDYSEKGDKVLSGVSSKDLEKKGWKHSGNNIPAAYATGLLLAKKVKTKKAILDIGLQKNHPKGRIYAALKGVIDGGIVVPHREEIFPSEERLLGNHLNKEVAKSVLKLKEKLK
jgi:large subunit ribosomal protein L18